MMGTLFYSSSRVDIRAKWAIYENIFLSNLCVETFL